MEKQTKKVADAQGAEATQTSERVLGKNLPMVQPKPVNPQVTLAQTIKTVSELHTKVRHLDRLETYTEELEKFKVKNKEEDLDDKSSYYAGCKLELRDDANRTFTLKHPVVVKEVIEFVLGRLSARKAEIEAQIKLPAAA